MLEKIKTLDSLKPVENIPSGDCENLKANLCKEILLNALKCKTDSLDVLDLKIINKSIFEFRNAARVFKPYRNVRKVSIFGSSRVSENTQCYNAAKLCGRLMAEQGFMVITGAGQGVMKAGIEGGGAENSFGIKIMLPDNEEPCNGINLKEDRLIYFKYFFTRKTFFVMEADAFILFPGGFGTHDEGFEVLTLLQTGKAAPMPVILMELPGDDYWACWDLFVRWQLVEKSYIRPEDLSFYQMVHSPEEAAAVIKEYYSTYHSLRQVHDKLVIRLEKELTDKQIGELNYRFKDIVREGFISKTDALPEEKNEPDILTKPRLVFSFNNRNYGRLNQLIQEINRLGRTI